jgi:hypothetical protein
MFHYLYILYRRIPNIFSRFYGQDIYSFVFHYQKIYEDNDQILFNVRYDHL